MTFLQFVDYCWNTNWQTKCEDWRGYVDLKDRIWHKENELYGLRGQMTLHLRNKNDLYKPIAGCIKIIEPEILVGAEYEAAERNASYCSNFLKGGHGFMPTECIGCPQYRLRNQYETAARSLDIMRGWLKKYWDNRFARRTRY